MKQTLQLAVLSSLGVLLAFGYQWTVLTLLGPGPVTDALFAGMTLPQLALLVVSGSLMHVLVPLLAGEDSSAQKRDAWAYLWRVSILFSILASALFLTTDWWVPLVVPGFDVETRQLTVDFTRVQLVGMVFSAINGVQWAFFHAQKRFLWGEIVPLLAGSVALVSVVILLPRYGPMAAAWVANGKLALQVALMVPAMLPVRFATRTVNMTEAWARMRPLLLGNVYYKTDALVDRYLLSGAPAGSMSLFHVAQQIFGAATQVINRALAAPLVPRLSEAHKLGDVAAFRAHYRRALALVGLVCFAGMVLLVAVGRPVLELLLGWGKVSVSDVGGLWWMMLGLSGAFVCGALGSVSSVSFYAAGDTRTPTRLGILSYTVFVPIRVVAYSYFGVHGLAVAASAFVFVNLVGQLFVLSRRYLKRGVS